VQEDRREEQRDELPLDELREAWRSQSPAEPADELEEADPKTRATVAWMRAAWQALEVPEPRLPAPRRARFVRLRPRLVPLVLAAAAAVLVMLGVYLAKDASDVQRMPEQETRLAQGEGPSEPLQRTTEVASSADIAYLGDDRMELRSGPVRLVLLTRRDTQGE
jgi:hypothetical protein